MDEAANNLDESTPKRSRSSEEILNTMYVSFDSDNGLQSSIYEEHGSGLSVFSSSNNNSDFSTNVDSGLSFKMEDPSRGVGAISGVLLNCDRGDENIIGSTSGAKNKEEDQDHVMLTYETIQRQIESGDEDLPTTSTTIIKRHKRNRYRNYRVAGNSSSSSSNSSVEDRSNVQHKGNKQDQNITQEVGNGADDSVSVENNNLPELPLSPSPYMFLSNFHDSASSDSHSSSTSDSSSDTNDDDTDLEPSLFGDPSSPDYVSIDSGDYNRLSEKDDEIYKVLNKKKPGYTWCGSYELMRREHGLSGDGKFSLRNGFSHGFQTRFYASRHIVERMKISQVLRKHLGCVNCVNFNRGGDLLVTGSDDARLIIWDWAGNKAKRVWKSGHNANIFQSKFLSSTSCIDIISAGRDGKVRRSIVPPSGGKVKVTELYMHSGAVHKLVISPDNISEIITVGEDGCICSKDLREDKPKHEILKVFSATNKSRKVRLFSISHHPIAPEICVSGTDQYVRVYDKRSMRVPVHTMSPEHILETHSPYVTCCVYNHTGTEILATYSEDNIYLFDNKNYVPGQYLHSYKGHFNQKTIKGVNFFGPNSEYVISGSDCGNVFFWDKNTEAIINFMRGDATGVVNCLEPHPNMPILATSGLDHNVKIWTPNAEKGKPDLTKLTNCVRRNIRRTGINLNPDVDVGYMEVFLRQLLHRHRSNRRNRNRDTNESGSDNDASSDDLSAPDTYTEDEDDMVDDSNLGNLSCATQ